MGIITVSCFIVLSGSETRISIFILHLLCNNINTKQEIEMKVVVYNNNIIESFFV